MAKKNQKQDLRLVADTTAREYFVFGLGMLIAWKAMGGLGDYSLTSNFVGLGGLLTLLIGLIQELLKQRAKKNG